MTIKTAEHAIEPKSSDPCSPRTARTRSEHGCQHGRPEIGKMRNRDFRSRTATRAPAACHREQRSEINEPVTAELGKLRDRLGEVELARCSQGGTDGADEESARQGDQAPVGPVELAWPSIAF